MVDNFRSSSSAVLPPTRCHSLVSPARDFGVSCSLFVVAGCPCLVLVCHTVLLSVTAMVLVVSNVLSVPSESTSMVKLSSSFCFFSVSVSLLSLVLSASIPSMINLADPFMYLSFVSNDIVVVDMLIVPFMFMSSISSVLSTSFATSSSYSCLSVSANFCMIALASSCICVCTDT